MVSHNKFLMFEFISLNVFIVDLNGLTRGEIKGHNGDRIQPAPQ